MNTDLTAAQNDYAVFLPALSGFYSTYVGKQRFSEYVEKTRIPSNFVNGIESLNYLNKNEGAFHYKWTLYSAGHANLDTTKADPKEDMIRNRDRENSWLLGDSGGYQIGMGVWEGDWKNPNCPKASLKRTQVLKWMDTYMDYGMTLDVPSWILSRGTKGKENSGITCYQDAIDGTFINNDYFVKNRNGNCKFLNVLQGDTHSDTDYWYSHMKKYCDPKQYPDTHFNGWSMGGQHTCDIHIALKRIVDIRFDGLLEKGKHDIMHFLGTSRLEWALMFTDIQRAVRKHHNENFTITYDCASPFLATANGQIYLVNETPDRGKWTYRMQKSVDNKKYATDSRMLSDVFINDGHFKRFEDSPITTGLKISDVCIYKDGIRKSDADLAGAKFDFKNIDHYDVVPDLNKIGKIGRTSWDSFSYAIQMGHNVWSHINAVQEANRQYDAGLVPAMLVQETFDREYFKDVIEEIFATSDKSKALALIEDYSRFWMAVPGNASRGKTGKKTINARTSISDSGLFKIIEAAPVVDVDDTVHPEDFSEEEINKLGDLEDEQL